EAGVELGLEEPAADVVPALEDHPVVLGDHASGCLEIGVAAGFAVAFEVAINHRQLARAIGAVATASAGAQARPAAAAADDGSCCPSSCRAGATGRAGAIVRRTAAARRRGRIG